MKYTVLMKYLILLILLTASTSYAGFYPAVQMHKIAVKGKDKEKIYFFEYVRSEINLAAQEGYLNVQLGALDNERYVRELMGKLLKLGYGVEYRKNVLYINW